MQIARRPAHRDFERDDAAQRVGKRGIFQAGHAGVRNDDGVAKQFAAVCFEKVREARAADLLLAFDDERQIARQLRAGFQIRLDCLQMREVLTLVISRAARENFTSNDARLKRRRRPQIKRLRRLHVVMAVNHVMRPAVGRTSSRAARRRFGQNNWMAFRRTYFRVQSDLPAMSHQPLRAGAHVFLVLRLRRDAGQPEIVAQLGHKTGLVLF